MDESFKIESAALRSGADIEPSERIELIVLRARGLYLDVCDELERTDPDDVVSCLLLSDAADALDVFVRGCNDER